MEKPKIIDQALTWIESNPTPDITSQKIYDSCNVTLKQIKSGIKSLDDKRKELTKPINQSIKNINAMFKVPIRKLKGFEHLIKSKMLSWIQEIERIQREEQRKQEEAERKARQKKLAEEAEAMRKAEEARRTGNKEAAKKEEMKAFLVSQKKIDEPSPAIYVPVSKGQGTYTVKSYQVEIVDNEMAIRSLIDMGMYEFLSIETGKLNKLVNLQDGKTLVKGIKVTEKESLRTRSN